MSNNRQLAAIVEYMPDYAKCRNEFIEHFDMFKKLGVVNYSALGQLTGFQGTPEEIVGVFLAGLALGKVSEISEQGGGEYIEHYGTVWDALVAWNLIEDELEAIRPVKRLPEPASIEVEVKAPGRRRRRSS
jgi:hypothetical protein